MTLKVGRLTELTARASGERLLKRYRAAGPGKELFAV
jgi:hypothetical protein